MGVLQCCCCLFVVFYVTNVDFERPFFFQDQPLGSGNGMRYGKRHFRCRDDHSLFVPIEAALSEEDFEGKPSSNRATGTEAPGNFEKG